MSNATGPSLDEAAAAADRSCPNCGVGHLPAEGEACPVCGYTDRPAVGAGADGRRRPLWLVLGYAASAVGMLVLAAITVARLRGR